MDDGWWIIGNGKGKVQLGDVYVSAPLAVLHVLRRYTFQEKDEREKTEATAQCNNANNIPLEYRV